MMVEYGWSGSRCKEHPYRACFLQRVPVLEQLECWPLTGEEKVVILDKVVSVRGLDEDEASSSFSD